MSKKLRAIVFTSDMLILAVVIAFTIGLLFLISRIDVLRYTIAITSEVQFMVFNNEKGGALESLFASTSNGVLYEEILGSVTAKDFPEGMDTDINRVVNKLNGGLSVNADGKSVKTYGTMGARTVASDIALPGVNKGTVTVS